MTTGSRCTGPTTTTNRLAQNHPSPRPCIAKRSDPWKERKLSTNAPVSQSLALTKKRVCPDIG
eukprot:CAMPEP_0204229374 /NCGR_PEP_ID=MMETSP0361-20130328/87155_1 /ASSEMBLY_ACC=CAM_ASM_000343 /TAXON_ID=268821 /ORGANISM="Scrippsiella Hangoei, Strain SHTV-5" /LENGTH=62 /DNA_ID=CAMNT_0051197807 /DNA_START=90 /DNA_END=274 /DNA_ORIENTATION=-